jgi:hypothetical protein
MRSSLFHIITFIETDRYPGIAIAIAIAVRKPPLVSVEATGA